MLLLSSSVKSFQAKTSILPNTPLNYISIFQVKDGTQNISDEENGIISNDYTDILSSPVDGAIKELTNLTINNTDNQNQTISISIKDSSLFNSNDDTVILNKTFYKAYLEPNWTLSWELNNGWVVYDEKGTIKLSKNNDLNPLAKYKISDEDSAEDPNYYGFVSSLDNSTWYVLKIANLDTTPTYRYANLSNNPSRTIYDDAGILGVWVNRASLTYDFLYNLTGL